MQNLLFYAVLFQCSEPVWPYLHAHLQTAAGMNNKKTGKACISVAINNRGICPATAIEVRYPAGNCRVSDLCCFFLTKQSLDSFYYKEDCQNNQKNSQNCLCIRSPVRTACTDQSNLIFDGNHQ